MASDWKKGFGVVAALAVFGTLTTVAIRAYASPTPPPTGQILGSLRGSLSRNVMNTTEKTNLTITALSTLGETMQGVPIWTEINGDAGGGGDPPPDGFTNANGLITFPLGPFTAGSYTINGLHRDSAIKSPLLTLTVQPPPGDTTLPTITITAPQNNAHFVSTTPSVVVSGVSSDNVSVAGMEVSVNNGAFQAMSPPNLNNWSISISNLEPDTTYNVRVRSIDAAGNKSTIKSVTIIVDPTPVPGDGVKPTVTVTFPPTNGTVLPPETASFTAQGICADNVGVTTVKLKIDAGPFVTIRTGVGLTTWSALVNDLLPDTDHTLVAQVLDAAGNFQTDTRTFSVGDPGPPPGSGFINIPLFRHGTPEVMEATIAAYEPYLTNQHILLAQASATLSDWNTYIRPLQLRTQCKTGIGEGKLASANQYTGASHSVWDIEAGSWKPNDPVTDAAIKDFIDRSAAAGLISILDPGSPVNDAHTIETACLNGLKVMGFQAMGKQQTPGGFRDWCVPLVQAARRGMAAAGSPNNPVLVVGSVSFRGTQDQLREPAHVKACIDALRAAIPIDGCRFFYGWPAPVEPDLPSIERLAEIMRLMWPRVR